MATYVLSPFVEIDDFGRVINNSMMPLEEFAHVLHGLCNDPTKKTEHIFDGVIVALKVTYVSPGQKEKVLDVIRKYKAAGSGLEKACTAIINEFAPAPAQQEEFSFVLRR